MILTEAHLLKVMTSKDHKKLILDNLNISSANILSKYNDIEFLSLRYNQLKSLSFINKCKNLWVIDLQQNQVKSY